MAFKIDNKTALLRGLERGVHIIEDVLFNILYNSAVDLLLQVAENKEFQGFTGNTQTSYMVGIYQGGALKAIVNQENWKRPPVNRKLRKGEGLYLEKPYEGHSRFVKGKVDVGEKYGSDTSVAFLKRFTPRHHGKKGFAMVLTTGTEYSVIIEEVYNLDVLTKTMIDAPKILKDNWHTIEF